jgi:outer membrane scaffolding protein for murein synthesis (MipA/OmpV family)
VPAGDDSWSLLAPSRGLLGLALVSSADYAGSSRTTVKLRELFSLQYGRVRISSSHAGGLLDVGGTGPVGSGISTQLAATDRWRLGLSARVDSGRKSADSPALAGLPDVDRTVRARLGASYRISDHWSFGLSLSQDILGKGGGATASADIGYGDRLTASTTWSVGVGVSAANALNMRSYFGIDATTAAQTGRAPYEPSAGLRDVHTGLGTATRVSRHWVGFATVGAVRLLGGAADSPLTFRRTQTAAAVGLAYRWGD